MTHRPSEENTRYPLSAQESNRTKVLTHYVIRGIS